MDARQILKSVAPPIVVDALRKLSSGFRSGSIRFTGDFPSWEEAERNSTGYATPVILERTRTALLKVKHREAAYERDSVLFENMEYPFPLLAGLLRTAARDSRLSVLDFGGSLGTTYFQCRDFLPSLKEIRWSIVEQPAHVACGKADFENEELHFYESISDCLRSEGPNVLLLAGVVQYLPKPYAFLAEAVGHGFETIVVDRTSFIRGGRDRLTIQQVPEWITPAAYPCWFFSEARFLEQFNSGYTLISSFPCPDKYEINGDETYFQGFIFERKDAR